MWFLVKNQAKSQEKHTVGTTQGYNIGRREGRRKRGGLPDRKVEHDYAITFQRQSHIVAKPSTDQSQHQDLSRLGISRHQVTVSHQLSECPQVSTLLYLDDPGLVCTMGNHIDTLLGQLLPQFFFLITEVSGWGDALPHPHVILK